MSLPAHRSLFPLMFHAGAAAVIAQSALARELMVSFYGTEFALAAALSCWLVFVPLGALAAGGLLKLVRNGLVLLWGSALCLGLALPAQFLVARMIRPLLGVEVVGGFVSLHGMVVAAALAAAPVSFLVGFLFPTACRLEAAGGARDGARAIGRVYVAEALGACAAGAVMSLLLLAFQTPTSIAFLAGALWLLVCGLWLGAGTGPVGPALFAPGVLWVLACPWGTRGALVFAAVLCLLACRGLLTLTRARGLTRARRSAAASSLALAVLLALGFLAFGNQVRRWTLQKRWQTFDRFDLVASRESRYQHLDVGHRDGQYVVRQNGLQAGIFPDEWTSRRDAALLLTQHPKPRRLLVVGGGLGGLCQRLLGAGRVRVDYAEMDPALISLYREHLPSTLLEPLGTKRFAAYACDGRYFIRNVLSCEKAVRKRAIRVGGVSRLRSCAPYDIVLINLGDPASASGNRLYTVESFREVQRILAPGGVVAVWGITGNAVYLHGPVLSYTACLDRTLRAVFPRVVVRPGSEFCFFAGGRGGPTPDSHKLALRFDRLGLEPRMMREMFEREQFPRERVRYVRRQLGEARDAAPLNTDDRPVAQTLFLAYREPYTRQPRPETGGAPEPVTRSFFGRVVNARPAWFVLPFIPCLLVVVLLRRALDPGRAAAWACGLAIVTTGMFGLAAEMLIIYGYQARFGYVYRDISLVVGLFMLGLAAGAWCARRAGRGAAPQALVALEALQVVLLLALPGLMPLLSGSPYLFILLSPLAGILTGAEFPLASRVGVSAGYETGTVASVYDACDHVGAVIGAALTGLVLMPAFGLAASAALLACIKCASLLGLAAGRWGPSRLGRVACRGSSVLS